MKIKLSRTKASQIDSAKLDQLAKEAEEWDSGTRKVDSSWRDAPEALIGLNMEYKMKIKKFFDDTSLTWEERYNKLQAHHLEETKELMEALEASEKKFDEFIRMLANKMVSKPKI